MPEGSLILICKTLAGGDPARIGRDFHGRAVHIFEKGITPSDQGGYDQ